MNYIRDYTMYAAIFGFFSFVWFGWAQEKPRPGWRLPIGIAQGLAFLLCGVGVYFSIINWGAGSALKEVGSYTTYLIIFYVELFLSGLGAFVLIRLKKSNFISPWILFIVGTHFIALEFVFRDSALFLLAALLIMIAVTSVFISPKLQVANSAIAGIGAGTVLFCFAMLGMVRFLMA
jgi:hypothetical protein